MALSPAKDPPPALLIRPKRVESKFGAAIVLS